MYYFRNINWRLVLPIAAVMLFTASCAAVAQVTKTASSATAPTATTGTKTTQTTAQTGTQKPSGGGQTGKAAAPAGYDDTPASVRKLITDSQAAMKKYADAGRGVHFSDNTTLSLKNMTLLSEAEGDMMPGKAKYHGQIRMPKELMPCGCPNPILYDAVITNGMFYLKLQGDQWESKSTADLDDLNSDVDNTDFLQYVNSWKNLGYETLDGSRVYHVRIGYDANALYGKLEQELKPNVDPETRSGMDKLKTSVLVDDIWIGADNLLVYQVTSHFRNDDLFIDGDDMYMMWNWGEQVDIKPPI